MIDWGTVDPVLLEVEFRRDVEELLGGSPFTWRITEGYRTRKRSDLLYKAYLAGGPKAAPGGKSAHNWGLAVDVVLDGDPETPGVQPTWNIRLPGWLWLFAKAKTHPRLKSGVSFNDACHLERYQWTRHIKRPTVIV